MKQQLVIKNSGTKEHEIQIKTETTEGCRFIFNEKDISINGMDGFREAVKNNPVIQTIEGSASNHSQLNSTIEIWDSYPKFLPIGEFTKLKSLDFIVSNLQTQFKTMVIPVKPKTTFFIEFELTTNN